MVCDLRLVDFDPFCMFLYLKVHFFLENTIVKAAFKLSSRAIEKRSKFLWLVFSSNGQIIV